jgi:acyl-CoA synthetase (AMP-forming)/AMP-acid ligase II
MPGRAPGDDTRTIDVSHVFRSSFPAGPATAEFSPEAWRPSVPRGLAEMRPQHRTLLHALDAAARSGRGVGITLIPERVDAPEEHRSYRAIYREATQVAQALLDRGLRQGDRVLLVLPTSFEFITTFFGVGLAGGVPVPAYPPFGPNLEAALERLYHIAEHAEPRFCVTIKRVRALLGKLQLRVPAVREILLPEELVGQEDLGIRVRPRSDDAAFIQYTSGSTGRPKGVLLAHRNLVANIQGIGAATDVRLSDVVVSWLPLYHDMGLIGALLFSVYWRLPLALMSPTAFLARPVRWLAAITRHRGTLSPAPNFGYGLCVRKVRPEERKGLDLSSWRMALNGAEPISIRTVREFTETYAPHGFRAEAMAPVYGLAETSLAATFPLPGTPVHFESVDRQALACGHALPSTGRGSMELVSVGTPLAGHEVALVDEEGRAVGERRVGHIVVRGPSLMRGYFRDEAATAAVIRNGWLWTGDLGFLADGQLYVSGRVKDLIILRGRNFYAEDIERVAERVAGVRAGAAVAFAVHDPEHDTELAVLVCETRVEGEAERGAVATEVAATVGTAAGVHLDEVVMVDSGTIPKTSSGKKQRSRCRELYLSGDLFKRHPGRLSRALVVARSGASFLLVRARRLLSRRRAPD